MKIFRSLYAKIFGWFWLTLTVGAILVLLATVVTGTRPLGRRWMRLTQDLYAQSAVDFYVTGGQPALQRYLDVLAQSMGVQASLVNEQGRDVLGHALPSHVYRVLKRSEATRESTFELGRVWTAASPVRFGAQQYYFVMEVFSLHRFLQGQDFALPFLWRGLLAILVAGILCAILTRHIVAPMRALQTASLRLAAGDLSTRVLPAIGPRSDELADTARAFDQMADRIELLLRKRQELLADISHELRSPLTRLSVSLELMRRGEMDVLEQMQTDLDRMNAMIGQILLLIRLDVQPQQASMKPVDLAPMIESIATDAQFEMQAEDKTIAVSVQSGCRVLGDANLLRSCIENIVRNAMHYTHPQTTVDIRARMVNGPAGKGHCEITVRDRGPGVPANALPFLFDPFYRVSESRDLREGGTGLGLSISQKIVALHHGTITASNRTDGAGLDIRIVLPAV